MKQTQRVVYTAVATDKDGDIIDITQVDEMNKNLAREIFRENNVDLSLIDYISFYEPAYEDIDESELEDFEVFTYITRLGGYNVKALSQQEAIEVVKQAFEAGEDIESHYYFEDETHHLFTTEEPPQQRLEKAARELYSAYRSGKSDLVIPFINLNAVLIELDNQYSNGADA